MKKTDTEVETQSAPAEPAPILCTLPCQFQEWLGTGEPCPRHAIREIQDAKLKKKFALCWEHAGYVDKHQKTSGWQASS